MGKDTPEKLVNFNISILTDDGKTIAKPPIDKIKEVKDSIYNKAYKEISKKWYVNNMWYHEPCIFVSVAHKI